MKKFLLAASLIFSGVIANAQCAFDNTQTGGTINLACPASTTAAMNAGQYVVINVTSGITYTFQTCGGSGCDTQLSLYTAGGGTNLGYSDDACGLQSLITWTASFTGQVNLLLDQYFCTNSGAACPATVSISCSGPPTAPANDNPCGAVPLPVGGACSNTPVNINGATTATTGVPAPGCGGYNGGDVWYSVVVPANGQVTITSTAGTITDAAMAAYSAPSCAGPFTLLSCNDNANGAMPALNLSALTPGSTIYIRTWDFNNDNFGNFTICAVPGCNSGGGNTSCATADPFCTGTTYNYCNTTNVPSLGGGGIYGCLGSSPNPAFYYLNISTSGNIDIFMSQTSTTGVPIDVDFICWGPFASQAAMCGGISAGNIVDCSYSGAATETVNITGAVAGQWYMLMITNFSNQPGSVSFSQTAGSGTTNCNIVAPCTVTATSTPVSCNGGTNGTITATVTGTPNYTVSIVNAGGTTVGTQTGAGTTYTFTGLPAGTYTVNLGAGGPCTNTTTVTINQPVVLSATSNHTNQTCAAPCTGTLTAAGAGGTPAYTYNWSGGLGAGANKTGVCAGTYTVTVTDANGCTTTSTQTVTAPPVLTVTPTSTPTICSGACNGTLNATAAGGTAGYTFNWSGGLGAGASKTGVCAGTYTVTVTDAAGCTATANVTVANGPLISPSFTYNGNQCLTGNSFNFTNTSTVTGGTGPTTYAWNFGTGATPATSTATSPTGVVYSTTGNHSVTLTVTNNGCSQTVTVNVITHPMPTVTIASTNVLCNGACNGTLTATGAAGTAPFNYTWSGGLGTGASKTGVCPGTYTVTVTDANGCTSTASATITQPPVLTVSATGTNVTCNGACNGTLNATTTGGTGAVTFTWSGGLGAGASKTGVCPGTYTVTATDANGCTATASFTITQPPVLTVSATGTSVTCNGVCNGTLNATSTGGTGAVTFAWSGGLGAGASKTGVCAGTYTVTATDANGCTATASFTITQPPALTVSAAGTNVTCNGVCNGTLSASATGGTGAVTYAWSGGLGAGANKTGVCAGTYTVTATDANGCTATASFTIAQPPVLTVTATGTNVTCNGICNGTLTANASGGTAAYTYNWGALGTGANKTGVCAGTYSVTVTDANGCTATATVTITQPTAITLSSSSTNTNCGGSTGTATVVAAGGAGGYTYAWTGGQTTATATALAAGSYTVTVTDANGCTATTTQAVNNNSAPTATEIAASHVNVSCNGGNNGAGAVSVVGGTAPYTFSWSPAPGGGQGTSSATGLSAGTYSVTVTDANGCSAIVTIIITQPTALISSAVANNNVSCNGGANGSATVTASGGVGGNTFVWTPAPGSGQGTATVGGLTAQTYTVTVTNANNCTSVSTVTITQPAALTASIIPANVTCNGASTGSANLTVAGGTGAYTYSWTGPGAFTSNVQDPTGMIAGNYSVTVTDANGCIITATTTITQPPLLTVSATPVNAHCGLADGSASATSTGGTGAVTFTWYSNAALTTLIGTGSSLPNLAAGTYFVQATDANGCSVNTSVTITNLAGVTATATVNSNATGSGLCNGSATVTPSGGVAPYTFAWSNGAATATTNTLCAGSPCVTVTDASGCTATVCVTITEPGPLVVSVTGNNLLCNAICNGSATSAVSGGVTPYTYAWSNGAATTNLTNLCAGTYTLNVTDANGNTGSASVTISQPPAINLPVPGVTDVNCNGACDGVVNALASGGTGALSYNWSGGLGAGPAHSTACAGNYTVTVTDANGCTANATITVNEPAPMAVTFTTVSANCNASNGSATVTASGGTPPYLYNWSAGSTTATQTNIAAGTYSVTVTDSKGCIITANVTVGNNPPGVLSAVVNNQVSCFGASNGQATANLAGGAAPVTYSWNTAPVQNTAIATGMAPGTWTVTATDANGCVVTANVTITEPTLLQVTAAPTPVSCPGGSNGGVTSTTTGGTAPYTFNWTGGATTANITGLSGGTFTITSTDANGCTASQTVTVTQPAAFALNIATVNVNCFNLCNGGANATITGGTAPYSFVWNDPLTQVTAAAGNLCAGGYTVTITDNNGCTTAGNITITEPTQLTLTPSTVSSNCGQNDGQACVAPAGGVGPYSFLWSTNATTACLNNITGSNYSVTVTDANGCVETMAVPVTDIGGPTAAIIAQTNVSCFGGNNGAATVNMIGGTGIFTVQWDAAAGNQTTPTASNLTAGTYAVTITDAVGCSASTSVTITQPTDIIYIQNQDNPTCFSYCDGIAWVGVSGGVTPYTFTWTDGSGASAGGNNDSITGLCQGIYNLVMTDANGCVETMTYTLTEPAQLAGTLTSQNVTCNAACNGQATVNMTVGASPFTYQWSASAGSQTTQTATSLCAGAHSVLITDNNGCFMTLNTTITEPPVLDIVISAFGDVSCSGFCDGFAQSTATGGTGPYTFSWSNGASTQNINNICTGTYTVTVNDVNGCTDQVSVTISTPNPLVVNVTGVNLTCYNQCIGSVNAAITGGTTPYTIQWDDPNFATTNAVNNLCAGTYNVIVNDANGCNTTQTITLTQPPMLDFFVNPDDAFCQQANGQICISPMGGVAPLSIQWNDPNAQTSACAFNLLAGCYTATVTDANGCVKDSLLCINDIAGPTVALTSFTDVTCAGANDGSIVWDPQGGTGALTLAWVTGAGNPIPPLNGQTTSTSLSGDTYGIIVTDSAGCVATLTQFIAEPNPLVAAVTASTNPLCFGSCDGTATVSTSGGNGGNTFSWTSGAAPTAAANTGLCVGAHSVTVTDVNGCSASASVTLTQPTPLVTSIASFTNVSCNGFCNGQITLNTSGATQPYSFAWTNNVSAGGNAVALCPNNYNITVTDANGCTASVTQAITEPAPLVVTTTGTDETCSQCNGTTQSFVTGGTVPYQYVWVGGNTPTQQNNSALCNGTHTVTVTDDKGCVATSSVTINDQAGPAITGMTFTQPLCSGQSNGTATVNYTGGTGIINFAWNDPGAQTTQTASGLPVGTYCVGLTDVNGCVASQCVTVTQPNPLGAVADLDVTICYGDSTQVWGSGTGGTQPYTVNWQTPGLTGAGPIMVYPLATTTYCLTVTDANGCLSPVDCATVTVNPPLSVDVIAQPAVICNGETTVLSASGNGGNSGPYTFTWVDENNTNVPAVSGSTSSDATVTPTNTIWYFVTASDGCSIPATDSVEVTVNPLPQGFVNVADPDGCAAHTAQFVLNTDIATQFAYDFTCDGVIDVNSASTTTSYTYAQAGTYNVCVTFISAAGCSTVVSEPNLVTVYPVPDAGFLVSPDSTTSIFSPEFSFTEIALGEITYAWNFGDGNTSTDQNPQHTYADTGMYHVTQIVTSADGCMDTAYHYVIVEQEFTMYVPNAFTPDGDGTNDIFNPIGIGWDWDHYELFVFNRWGEVVYTTTNPANGWDGTEKGMKCKSDTYVWKIKVRDSKETTRQFVGHVTLLR